MLLLFLVHCWACLRQVQGLSLWDQASNAYLASTSVIAIIMVMLAAGLNADWLAGQDVVVHNISLSVLLLTSNSVFTCAHRHRAIVPQLPATIAKPATLAEAT